MRIMIIRQYTSYPLKACGEEYPSVPIFSSIATWGSVTIHLYITASPEGLTSIVHTDSHLYHWQMRDFVCAFSLCWASTNHSLGITHKAEMGVHSCSAVSDKLPEQGDPREAPWTEHSLCASQTVGSRHQNSVCCGMYNAPQQENQTSISVVDSTPP